MKNKKYKSKGFHNPKNKHSSKERPKEKRRHPEKEIKTFGEGVDLLIEEFEVKKDFPHKVLKEASNLPDSLEDIVEQELPRRTDLRQELTITLDGEKARDFDDAVSVQREGAGYRLKVSIADVSYFVLPGSELDKEAYERATSVYFADRVVPMFPEKISNHLCSLVPHEDRLTLTVEMLFSKNGIREEMHFYPSIICSTHRMTYTQARQILEDKDPQVRSEYADVVPMIEDMQVLAHAIKKRRSGRGSIDFDIPEPVIEINPSTGLVDAITRAERNEGHRLIEEFMIAANEAVADWVGSRDVPMVYRIHESPKEEKIENLKLMLHNLGIEARFGHEVSPADLAQVVKQVQGSPHEKLIYTLILRSMQQAIYDVSNKGHFGLASIGYSHFTSPIRRYPDLLAHRILKRELGALHNAKHKFKKGDRQYRPQDEAFDVMKLKRACHQSSERERAAMKCEWGSRDLAGAFFMQDKVGEVFDGVITGVSKSGIFIQIEPYLVEGRSSFRNMKDDYYYLDEDHHMAVGKRHKKKYQLGTPVKVRLESVNTAKRWIDLSFV